MKTNKTIQKLNPFRARKWECDEHELWQTELRNGLDDGFVYATDRNIIVRAKTNPVEEIRKKSLNYHLFFETETFLGTIKSEDVLTAYGRLDFIFEGVRDRLKISDMGFGGDYLKRIAKLGKSIEVWTASHPSMKNKGMIFKVGDFEAALMKIDFSHAPDQFEKLTELNLVK